MATGATTPILLMTGLSFANKWYSGHQLDFKIPLAGGVALVIASVASEAPALAPVVTGIAWVALVAAIVVPQHGILDPLLSLGNGVGTSGQHH